MSAVFETIATATSGTEVSDILDHFPSDMLPANTERTLLRQGEASCKMPGKNKARYEGKLYLISDYLLVAGNGESKFYHVPTIGVKTGKSHLHIIQDGKNCLSFKAHSSEEDSAWKTDLNAKTTMMGKLKRSLSTKTSLRAKEPVSVEASPEPPSEDPVEAVEIVVPPVEAIVEDVVKDVVKDVAAVKDVSVESFEGIEVVLADDVVEEVAAVKEVAAVENVAADAVEDVVEDAVENVVEDAVEDVAAAIEVVEVMVIGDSAETKSVMKKLTSGLKKSLSGSGLKKSLSGMMKKIMKTDPVVEEEEVVEVKVDNFTSEITAASLQKAAAANMLESVEYLVRKGVNVNGRDEDGNTALHLVHDYQWEIAEFLVAHGARFLKNSEGIVAGAKFKGLKLRKPGHTSGNKVCEKADWVKDESSEECKLCSQQFGFFTRRHHCRACGDMCCHECSANTYGEKKERVCDGCFNEMEAVVPTQTAEKLEMVVGAVLVEIQPEEQADDVDKVSAVAA